MPTIEETIAFIKQAHAGQKDKIGVDYYHHPIAVMKNLPEGTPQEVKLAALLHDVLEDTDYTRADLAKRGYSDATLDIVELVTNNPASEMTYGDKIRSIIDSGNADAVLVKHADVRHNSSPRRMRKLPAEERERLQEKYRLPLIMLTEAVKKTGYAIPASGQQMARM